MLRINGAAEAQPGLLIAATTFDHYYPRILSKLGSSCPFTVTGPHPVWDYLVFRLESLRRNGRQDLSR